MGNVIIAVNNNGDIKVLNKNDLARMRVLNSHRAILKRFFIRSLYLIIRGRLFLNQSNKNIMQGGFNNFKFLYFYFTF